MENVTLKEFEENLSVIESCGDLISLIDDLDLKVTKIELIDYCLLRLNNLKNEIENEKI